MIKHRVMSCSQLNYQCAQIIKKKYMNTINWSIINNEFLSRYYADKFPEEVEEAKQIIKRERELKNE